MGESAGRIRTFGAWLLGGTVLGVFVEWVIELLKEHGFFEKPSSRLEIVTSTFGSITTVPGFWPFFWALSGFVAGLWLDRSLRRIDERSAARREQSPSPLLLGRGKDQADKKAQTGEVPHYDPARIEGLVDIRASSRDDHDIVPVRFVVRGRMTDDGYDISALIQYRNRSDRYLMLKSLTAEFEIAERAPIGQLTDGVNADLPKQTTHQISFKPVRVYNARPVQGKARFAFRYGERNGPMRTILDMSYSFVVKSFPPDKSTDAVLEIDLTKSERYFVGEPLAVAGSER